MFSLCDGFCGEGGRAARTRQISGASSRLDFETDGGYENSVQFHGGLYRGDRDFLQRWGTKKLPDQVVEKDLSGFTVKLSDYAPENWTGRAILTFEMQNSGVGTSAKVTVR